MTNWTQRNSINSTYNDRTRPATGYRLDFLRGKNSAGNIVIIQDHTGADIIIRSHKEGFLRVSTEPRGIRTAPTTSRS